MFELPDFVMVLLFAENPLALEVWAGFFVIVDADNKTVVWGSNSNGEIGVGDSKVRNHPARLETIEDK